ncbi:hypothetical protein K432DRAFT_417213 [Lepidopterella palustris CBS 459.81]|uniref:Uncharacterized protein n=1 Tax=Lepidopterella palustris CBS 459.81 TaxID=1314670 RepID=A0A8E2JF23_9PEZI|nr:hypothetical protein K432DRAFT_417213 [Lepidopterella palustris CBS 459.81]
MWESGAGIPSAVLRFAIFVPFATYWSDADNHWQNVRKHVVLQQPPFNPNIFRGEQIAAKWGKIGFFWNFALWIPTVLFPGPLVFIVGLFDLTIATMLGIATHLQSAYSPHTYSACRNGGAETWQVPNGTQSFFTLAGQLNATKTTPETMCRDYVEEWKYGVAMAVCYSLIAAFNIILSAIVCAVAARDSPRHNRSFGEWILDTFMTIPRATYFIFICLVMIPVMFFRCLPISIKSRARFGARYAVKTGQRVPTPRDIKMRVMRPKNSKSCYAGNYQGKATNLADFLIYDVLVLIARDLHYVDLVNLSLASKSVHDAVFPGSDFLTRSEHFKMYTCDIASKTQCWVCTVQICDECQIIRSLRETPLVFHLDICKPHCSPCYFSAVCQQNTDRLGNTRCACAPRSEITKWQKIWHGPSATLNLSTTAPSRGICRLCNVLDDATLLGAREARSRAEMRDAGRFKNCSKCAGSLGSRGPRWWVCGRCKKECRSHVHPAWGEKGEP